MATTLLAIRRRMLEYEPIFGRSVALSSLTTTTAVANQLATGTVPAGKYTDKWMLRADASDSADRIRIASNFASSTGTFIHAGTDYADTTATGEVMEVWEYDPFLADLAVQQALDNLRYVDEFIFPTTQNSNIYSFHGDGVSGIDWVNAPADAIKVYYRPSPVLSNNRYFEKWNVISSGGVQQPDHYVLAGSGGTMALDESINDNASYGMRRRSLALTRASVNLSLTQRVRLLDQGLINSLRGQTITAVGYGLSSVASQLRLAIAGGVTTMNSSYHTGAATYEELTASVTVGATENRLLFGIEVNGDNTVCYLAELYLMVGSINDAVRNDNYEKTELRHGRDYVLENLNPLLLRTNRSYGLGSQLVVAVQRPWPRFDTTRVRAGSADSDTSDVPLHDVAWMAIAEMWSALSARNSGNALAREKAREWALKVAPMKAVYQYSDEERLMPLTTLAGPAPWRPR